MPRNRDIEWGSAKRPKVKNKIGVPSKREGSTGDIQVRQTNLGSKIFAKTGGRWHDVPLSTDGVTKIGTNLSNHLSIDRNSIDIITNNVKVATFGETTTVKDLNLTGKVVIISTGTQNVCMGTSNADLGQDNIAIGVNAGSSYNADTLQNIAIGTYSLEDTTHSGGGGVDGSYNIAVGYKSGLNITGGSGNVLIGLGAGASNTTFSGSGADITSGTGNICLGNYSGVDSASSNRRISIGRGVIGTANESLRMGDSDNSLFFDFSSSGGTIAVTSDIRTKKNIIDTDIGLDFINLLRPIKYVGKNKFDYPDEFNPNRGGERMPDPVRVQDGLIAQEVKKVMEDMDVTFSGWIQDVDTRQMLGYDVFVMPLIKAVQELSAKVDVMQVEINNLN